MGFRTDQLGRPSTQDQEEDGDVGSSWQFLAVHGARNLYFIGGLTFGSVFGELVMLGVQALRCDPIRDPIHYGDPRNGES